MKRDIPPFGEQVFDLVVIGGGIFGICTAWDAALRGMSVALLEQGDFAHAASANCFKVVHGGIRYLQHLDIRRVRESCRERSILLRIAPHLVRPLPFLIPTYGYGMKGKAVLRCGIGLYDLLTFDRNRHAPGSDRRVPKGYTLSKAACLQRFPGLSRRGLTGGAVFYDGQMYSPARLALSLLKSAVSKGAVAANYIRVESFLRRGGRVAGVRARDLLSRNAVDVCGRFVVCAGGAWTSPLLEAGLGIRLPKPLSFSRDTAFVVRKRLHDRYALAVEGASKDPDAVFNRGNRHLFIVPWRDCALVGVWHRVYRGDPGKVRVSEEELKMFINEVNSAYPPIDLRMEDVIAPNYGLVLFGDTRLDARDLSYGKRSVIIDHGETHRVDGLISLVGVRYTTARGDAARTVDAVVKKLGKKAETKTDSTPVDGGNIQDFQSFYKAAMEKRPDGIGEKAMKSLLHHHGTSYTLILQMLEEDASLADTVDGSETLRGAVLYAVREEMAVTLSDVVFRRTDLGASGNPGEKVLAGAAQVMAAELGWSAGKVRDEIARVRASYPPGFQLYG